ncbi:MAG: type II toxin-antitoxin system Phd/YefM family antitoxin [Pyrinomonadaceae bacterium]
MRAEIVTTLKRRATELIAEVERDGVPILITRQGLPSAYLVDVETFESQQRRMELLEAIVRGERDVAEGRVLSNKEAKRRLSKWLD